MFHEMLELLRGWWSVRCQWEWDVHWLHVVDLGRWKGGLGQWYMSVTKTGDGGSGVDRGNGGEGVCGGNNNFWYCLEDISRVRPGASKVLADCAFELLQCHCLMFSSQLRYWNVSHSIWRVYQVWGNMYEDAGLWCVIWGSKVVGGDGFCGLNEGMGEVDLLGTMAGRVGSCGGKLWDHL